MNKITDRDPSSTLITDCEETIYLIYINLDV